MISEKQCEILGMSPLFKGLEPERIRKFLEYGGIFPRSLEREEYLISQGEAQTEICVVLSGGATGEKLSANGKAITINAFRPGDVFGDVLSGAAEKSPVSVKMTEPGEVIAIPFTMLIGGAENLSDVRERVLRNLINEIGKKYFALQRRVNMLTHPTLRGKIAIYLLEEINNAQNKAVIPHSREEQARLLSCDRSALSRELARMKNEKIIDFNGREFVIKDRQKLKEFAE